jgi:hypothetical protein
MTDAETLEGSDLVLLMLAAPTEVKSATDRINGITRLEKLLYLADRETTVQKAAGKEKLNFIPYNFGPFSKDVYEAVELLAQSHLLKEERFIDGRSIDSIEDSEVLGASEGDDYTERRFVLTPEGKLVANLLAQYHPHVVTQLSDVKNKYADRPLSSLIRYVYKNYPESAVNSKIADRF